MAKYTPNNKVIESIKNNWESEMYKQYIQFELNNDDKKLIMSKLSEELQKFVKRLNTYLKKYGLSCVHSWSYWRDA